MVVKALNISAEIRKYVVDKFTSMKKGKLTTYDEEFLYEVNNMPTDKRYSYMASIIYDVYVSLKWRKTLDQLTEDDIFFLELLEAASTFDDVIEIALSEDNLNTLLNNLYSNNSFELVDNINAKNNIRNVEVNDIIIEADKLHGLDDLSFYENGFIFNKDYNKEQYLNLYSSLRDNCKDVKTTREAFTEIVSAINCYNKTNYDKLILDMCVEFLFQKSIQGNYDECDYDEDYLILLIKHADVDRIIEVVTDNDKAMEALTYSYESYPHFKNDIHRQQEDNNPESETQKIYKRLHKGKNKN